MSGPGDDRWRGGPSRSSSQRHSSNANRDRSNGRQGGPRGGNAAGSGGSGPGQDQHVPVRGFNAAESKNLLKRGPGEQKATFYKPSGKDASSQRSGGAAWGSKSNTMANGKDFFIELRKQVASLQRSGTPMGG